MLEDFQRYWHTIRYLRSIQVFGRAWFKVARPRPDLGPAPPVRRRPGEWIPAARRDVTLVGPDEFEFLGEHGSITEIGWDGPQREKLWRYNQHYFDDLNAFEAASRTSWHQALLADWVESNPPPHGNGWEPYPVSLRIVNWVKWVMSGHELPVRCHESLAVQARWLMRRLEFHLLGNHLLANAKALVFCGLYFEGPEGDRWLDRGLSLFEREVREQILNDGGHFERSTMYHALVLEDILDVCNMMQAFHEVLSPARQTLGRHLRVRVADMIGWLRAMCHPDGELGFFNDAAMGIAPTLAELTAYAGRLGIDSPEVVAGVTWKRESGYLRLARGEAVALLDVAPIGPDYLPGHAHADTLSFELSLFGQRILVNSGTSCYGNSVERLRQRGTAAHNTVVIGGENSSEVWGGFRVARRARPGLVHVRKDTELSVTCSHDGYRRLPGQPVHMRRWVLNGASLTVTDVVHGGRLYAEGRYHFHPSLTIESDQGGRSGTGGTPNGRTFAWHIDVGEGQIEKTTWHPRFGASETNVCIVLRLVDGCGQMRLSWK
jgi:uncharacterized heparinase superfamily protein